jgi:predicted nucleic acid-binding protein
VTLPEKGIVVSNTSPINYLILTGYIEILPLLYEKIIIPQAVFNELTHPEAPAAVREWMGKLPKWVSIQTVSSLLNFRGLHQGEQEVLSLAVHLNAHLLLLDDGAARKIADQRGLLFTGTVGILAKAAERGLLSLSDALRKLGETNYRINDKLLEDLLHQS